MDNSKDIHITLLIADLAGYTAMTEAHGNRSAAEIVTRYMEIVQDSLHRDTRLVEQVGDEVMIVSSSADNILSTAIKIRNNIEREPFFPAIHAGLHAGMILEMDGRYFGTTLNLTSRITAYAKTDQILCTEPFCDLVGNLEGIEFHALGLVKFKNIVEPIAIFEIITAHREDNTSILDPVCRMLANLNTAPAQHSYEGKTYYFCSSDCAKIFGQGPENYTTIRADS